MSNSKADTENCIPNGQMNLINTLRKFWMELPMWRRSYLVSYASGYGDLEVLGDRLYYAPTDLGNILEAFFGDPAARTVENMIREQIVLSAQILRAEKTGDTQTIDQNTETLYRNVDKLAAYLAQINPYWDEQTWKNIFYDYYKTTILEMVLMLSGKFKESVTLYESLQNQALRIADYMGEGMIPYFAG